MSASFILPLPFLLLFTIDMLWEYLFFCFYRTGYSVVTFITIDYCVDLPNCSSYEYRHWWVPKSRGSALKESRVCVRWFYRQSWPRRRRGTILKLKITRSQKKIHTILHNYMQVEYSFDVEEAIMRLAVEVADLVLVFLDPVRRRKRPRLLLN